MTPDQFATLALSLPEAVESSHHGTRDFRVNSKVFATLGNPDAEWGVIKLTPELQDSFVEVLPEAFIPVPGGWGERGYTRVRLEQASEREIGSALTQAWKLVAPKRLIHRLDGFTI